MSNSLTAQPARCQGNLPDRADSDRDKTLVLRRMLRESIEESGWKYDAIAAYMSKELDRKIDEAYFSKMLSGEKPIGLIHLLALPDDIEAIFSRKYAESFGQIVVAPAESKEAAVKQFVAGLFGMLHGPTLTLPETAGAPLKVALDHKKRAAR